MNPNISKDVKLTHSTEEVVEKINTLHWYVNLKFELKIIYKKKIYQFSKKKMVIKYIYTILMFENGKSHLP